MEPGVSVSLSGQKRYQMLKQGDTCPCGWTDDSIRKIIMQSVVER